MTINLFDDMFSRYFLANTPCINPYKAEFVAADPFVLAALSERAAYLKWGVWQVSSASSSSKDEKISDFLRNFLNSNLFFCLASKLVFARVKGIQIAEIKWEGEGESLRITDTIPLSASLFDFRLEQNKQNRPSELTYQRDGYNFYINTLTGMQAVNPYKICTFISNNNSNYPLGEGLVEQLYITSILNPETLKSAAHWIKRFASPVPIATYTVEAGPQDTQEALKSYSEGKYFGLPEGTELSLLEAQTGDKSKEFYDWMLSFCKKRVRSLILGESFGEEANQGLAGKPAESDDNTKKVIAASDAAEIVHQITPLLKFLVGYKFDNIELPEITKIFPENEQSLTSRSQRDKTLFDMGFTLKMEAVSRIYGDDYKEDKSNNNSSLFQSANSNIHEFRALVDRIIKWNDLELGVEYLPGQVRFPGTNHARKIRCAYGHIRNYRNTDGEALDCYVHPDLLEDNNLERPIFVISQWVEEKFDEYKIMIGWTTMGAAEAAYLQEMPEKYFGGIEQVFRENLEQFKKGAKVDFEEEIDAEVNFGFNELELEAKIETILML